MFPGELHQLTLDGAGALEDAAIHLVEFIVGCVENEAARDTDRDPDGAAVKLYDKSLVDHEDSTPASRPRLA
jgi:hypothetical protein